MHGSNEKDLVRLPDGALELGEIREIQRLLTIFPRAENQHLRMKLHGPTEQYRRELLSSRTDGTPQTDQTKDAT
jgi:hypothetical protein